MGEEEEVTEATNLKAEESTVGVVRYAAENGKKGNQSENDADISNPKRWYGKD